MIKIRFEDLIIEFFFAV